MRHLLLGIAEGPKPPTLGAELGYGDLQAIFRCKILAAIGKFIHKRLYQHTQLSKADVMTWPNF
jgi:hypothetical protein